jgi:hypothetical protein
MSRKTSKAPDVASKEYLVEALAYVCSMVKKTARDFHHFGPNDNRDNLERIAAIGGNALYQAGYKRLGRQALGAFAPFKPWTGEELKRVNRERVRKIHK